MRPQTHEEVAKELFEYLVGDLEGEWARAPQSVKDFYYVQASNILGYRRANPEIYGEEYGW